METPKDESVSELRSAHLGNERPIWIRRPSGNAGRSCVTIFLDGELYRDRVNAPCIIDNLISRRAIADSWILYVSMQSEEARWKECPCYPPFAKFVVEELLPWLAGKYPESRKASRRVLVGLSYTGLAAAFIAKEYPGVFQKVISQSGSFWSNDCWLIKQVASMKERLPTDFYLDVGTGETQENVQHREDVLQVVSQIDGVKRFRDVLLKHGNRVKYVEYDGGHDFLCWKQTLPAALEWALPIGRSD